MPEKIVLVESLAKTLCENYLQDREHHQEVYDYERCEEMKKLSTLIEDCLNSRQLAELNEHPRGMKNTLEAIIVNLLKHNADLRRKYIAQTANVANNIDARTVIFISYRRSCSVDFVRHLTERLNNHPRISAEFDKGFLRAGEFPSQLGNKIKRCHILLLVLRPDTLQNIRDKENWIRRELVTALHHNKEIIPLLVDADAVIESADWPSELAALKTRQAIVFKRDLFDSSMDILCRQLLSLRKM